MAKITKVTYAALANLGNYENERLELELELKSEDSWEDCLADLKTKVHSQLHNEKNYLEYCQRYREKQQQLRDISEKLQVACSQWEETSNFLISQGLKPSVPSFPFEKQNLITAEVESLAVSAVEDDFDDIPM